MPWLIGCGSMSDQLTVSGEALLAASDETAMRQLVLHIRGTIAQHIGRWLQLLLGCPAFFSSLA